MLEAAEHTYQPHLEATPPFILVFPGCSLVISDEDTVTVLPIDVDNALELQQAQAGYVKTVFEPAQTHSRESTQIVTWLNGQFYVAELQGQSYPIRCALPVQDHPVESLKAPKKFSVQAVLGLLSLIAEKLG